MKKLVILFIVTSQGFLGEPSKPTGLWLEEFTTPYYALKDAGYDVDIVSVSGGKVPVDPRSLPSAYSESPVPASVARMLIDPASRKLLENTRPLSAVDTSRYAAVFFPGGHGTMWDLPNNPQVARIVSSMLASGRVVAAVCHGPAALVGAKNGSGEPLVKGRRVAAFTDSEEKAVGLAGDVPFLLESRLRELGAIIEKVEDFQPLAVADGKLITGQNPASSDAVAQEVIRALRKL